MKKYKKLCTLLCALVLSIVPMSFYGMEANAAQNKPVITTPTQYQEFLYGKSITIEWTQSGEAPSRYYVNIRELSRQNTNDTDRLIVQNAVTTKHSMTIDSSKFLDCSVFRLSVAAEFSDGTKKYSTETYFLVSAHTTDMNTPISFKVWSGFATATKNAVYYAARSITNAVGFEVINTYAFSDDLENDYVENVYEKDGMNIVSGIAVGTEEYLMITTSRDGLNKPKEFDININKSHAWVNTAREDRYDVQSSMTHEMGHVAGLAHIYEDFAADWTMYGNGTKNSIAQRSLEQEDIDCLNDLY